MKNRSVPRSPFSTALSGNAHETELRIRNIVSGPKKRPPLLLVALMCAVALLCGNLVSCQQSQTEEPDASLNTPLAAPDTDNWKDAFQQVLLGQASFLNSGGNQMLSIHDLTPAVPDSSDLHAQALRFTVLDLDGDDTPEAVLWLVLEENDNAGFLILRWESGSVQGYYRPSRTLMSLKTDGSFTCLSDSADFGFGSLVFDGSQCREQLDYFRPSLDDKINCFARQFVTPYSSGSQEPSDLYLPIEPEQFQLAADLQAKKPEVYWTELTEENISAALEEPNKYHVYHINATPDQTLTLLCHTTTADQLDPSRPNCDAYRYIQVFDGTELLQTISEDTVVQDDSHLFEGFLSVDGLDVRDVNFDGAPDFGILCGLSYNGPMYWFLWDEQTQQFRPGFFSALELTVNEDTQLLIDSWRDGLAARFQDTYRFKTPWERELVDHRQVEFP